MLNGFHPILFRDPVTGGRCGRSPLRLRSFAVLLAGIGLGAGSAHAVDGMWLAAPATTDWNTGTNWSSSPAVPTGTATFGGSTKNALTFSADTSIGNLQFNAGAPIYSFDLSGHNWLIGGNNLDTVINGTISDSGSGGTLTKTGAGTLTLSGNNTYAGVPTLNPFGLFVYNNGTTVTGGTLEIANVNALGTGAVTLSGGTLRATITGTIANSVLSDSNTTNTISAAAGEMLTLGPNGGNSYIQFSPGSVTNFGSMTDTGTVIVASDFNSVASDAQIVVVGGTLRDGSGVLGNATSFTQSTTVNAGATLDFNDQTDAVHNLQGAGKVLTGTSAATQLFVSNDVGSQPFAGVIAGPGGVFFAATDPIFGAVTTLTGANTYAGGTVIDSLTALQLGDGGSSGSIIGNVLFQDSCGCGPGALGALVFNRSDSYTFAGTISGPGSVIQAGTGTTILTADSDYSGGTTIVSGALQLGNGGTTGSITGDVFFCGCSPSALIFDRSDSYTFEGTISGPGSVVQAGTGTTILTADSDYNAGTTILSGTLQLGNGGTTGSIAGDVVDNGVFAINRSDTYTFAGNISGAGAFLMLGPGVTTLAGVNTYSGATVVNAGTLQAGAVNVFGNLSATTVNAGGILDLNSFNQTLGSLAGAGNVMLGAATLTAGGNNTSTTYSGGISGTGALVKQGTGTFVLTGANSYNGGTTISAGTLQLGNGGTTGSIAGDVTNNGTFAFNRSDIFTFGGVITGSGGVNQMGPGTLTLTAANGYSGGTTVSGGALAIGADNNIGTGPLALLAGTTLQLTQGFNFTHPVTVAGDPTIDVAVGNTNMMSGVISDGAQPGDIVKTGAGTLTFTANNTYSGGTTISAGTLALSGSGSIAHSSGVHVANAAGTFDISGTTTGATIKTLDGVASSSVVLGSRTLTLSNASGTFNGVISGPGGALTLNGGTETLTGNNAYTGGTTISAGTLALGNGGTSGSILGNITDNGTFAVNRSDIFTFGGVISGNGAFQQLGAGMTVFTGANGYTGGTTISAGTLQLGNGGTSGSILGNIADNGTFAINRSDIFTFGGMISGNGAFQQLGAGTTVFTGANTYTGGTTISAGTLQLGNGGTSGSILGNITDNGTFAINRSDIFTFGGVITGSGGVNQMGPGTLTLTAANNYSGGTTVSGGKLAIGADNNIGTGPLALLAGTTLQFTQGFNFTHAVTVAGDPTIDVAAGNTNMMSGVISDGAQPGDVVKTGAGTLTFTANNSYTGGTTISAGTLQLGNGGTSGSILGNITDNGTFAINRSDIFTFGSMISGNGAFQQLGTGTTVFTGANSYTGGTTISAGTLQLGNGGTSGSILGNITDNGTFAINRSDIFTFGGVISGNGAFQQNGPGTTVLTGTNTFSGATTVNAGALMVNGSIASSNLTSVNSGSTLTGIGTVGKTQINSGGAFAPGTPGVPGTSMTVSGSLAFQSGALYLVQVNPTSATKANVTGTASLAGNVLVALASGSYMAKQYTILHSAGLSGTTFDAFGTTNLPSGFAASLGYTSTDALLNLTAALAQSLSLSGNQQNVANSLNNFFNGGGTLTPSFLTIFGFTGGNLANALTLLSGEAATGGQQAAFQLMNEFLGIMLDPFVDGRTGFGGTAGGAVPFAPERAAMPEEIALAYASVLKAPVHKAAPLEQRWSVWGSAYGGYNRTSGDPAVVGSHDLNARAAGVAAGMDYRFTRDTAFGFALAGGGTGWGLAQGLGSGKSDAFQAGVYGTTRSGPAYLAAALAFTNHWMSTDRFAVAGDHLTANLNAQSFGARIESGYRIASPAGAITPYAAAQAQSFRTPTYSETDVNGGGFGLAYNARTASDTRSELGARFDHKVAVQADAVLALRARVAWAHDWVSDPTLFATFQTLPGASFIVNGATPVKDSALVSAGAELRLANGVALIGKFDGELASRSATYAGIGTVRYAW